MDKEDIVAISYAHDDASFNKKVVALAICLRKHGYDARMDEYLKQEGTSIDFNEMMAKLITTAKKVIVLLTPKYKERADSFKGGVGAEYRIILDEIEKSPKKYIFTSFEPVNEKNICEIKPASLGNREIVYIPPDEEDWDVLFSKLSDEPIYDFPDVNVKKTKPRKEVVCFNKIKKKSDLFCQVRILLCENKQILEQFGPDSRVAINNPMSSVVDTWDFEKINTIIPNNKKIVEYFESNISLLSNEEVEIFIKFKIHADSFERSTKGEIGREGIPQFPVEFEQMIKEEI